ncbi:UDP-N-acetylmuramate--L-alanine ligase [Tomitella biformata]|uniref:UDP-N-acetylmuramate--L-alanine ligase n=1 Tax=Tomitella biformata TaxID=630403 RepID=UPI000688C740|nr:UDP-N-acetylmuramate--L-alanine ligase [Tomitella biformata]
MTNPVAGAGLPETDLPAHLRRVHMIGIGGAGMSGIARILLDRGGQVSGSDAKESRGVVDLRARGAHVRIGHSAAALDIFEDGPTAVVSTLSAIPKTNPELVAAAERGLPVILRPAVLASLMEGYRSLLVAGTHGKTSTTSMVVVALQHCRIDPSFVVGGELNESGTNAHHGRGDLFVAEADESDGSLLQYRPSIAIVTNVDVDHLDYFGTVEAYTQVFDDFVDRIEPGGLLVACLDDPGSAALAARALAKGVRVLGYGGPPEGVDGEIPAGEVPIGARLLGWDAVDGGGVGQLQLDGEDTLRTLRLGVPGKHMALNALGALLAARAAGLDVADVLAGLAAFDGVHRRFQDRGQVGGVRVIDDYAHHPTEVTAVLGAARGLVAGGNGRVVVVFQPHLYSRTEAFADEFAVALGLADIAVVLDVYGAREDPVPGVSGALIAENITSTAYYQPDLSAVAAQIAGLVRPGDLVLTMGAGDVTMLGPEILAALRDPRLGDPNLGTRD